MSNLLSFLKYVMAGTAVTIAFIIITPLVYLYFLHGEFDREMAMSLLQGRWPDSPVEEAEKEQMTLPDSLAQEFSRLGSQRAIMRTMRVGLDLREQRLSDEKQKLEVQRRHLTRLRAQIDSMKTAMQEQGDNRLSQVTKLVESMKPDQSVPILQNMPDDMVVDMLLHMKERQAAKILASLSPDRAARITQIMGMLN